MGFVKLPDTLSEWAWYYDNNTLGVYIRLFIEAAWKDTSYKNVNLKRGQAIATLPKLAEQSGLSVQQVRTILNRLKSTGKITVENTAKFSIITMLEYDCDSEINSQNNSLSTGYQQAGNSQATVCQQADNSLSTGWQQAPYNNKLSDNQTIRSSDHQKKTYIPDAKKTELEKSFEEFWAAYPKKTAKKNAFTAWKKIKPDDELLKIILYALERQKKSAQWQKDGRQFIPYPASWINGKRWEDEHSGEQSNDSKSESGQNGISKNPFINAVFDADCKE